MVETVSDEVIMDYYQGRCCSCRVELSVTIHEIVPRSKRPKTWSEFDNRAPLCNGCHVLATENTVTSSGWIRTNRKRFVEMLYGDRPPSLRAP